MPADADQANQQMVDRLIAEGALWSRPLIAAFRATPRHCFLDRVFQYQRKHQRWREIILRDPGPEELPLIYTDRALITHLSVAGRGVPAVPTSSSSQPSLMAQMLEDLQMAPGLRVLEVGAGTGYNAALIAHVVGPNLVTSIDVDRDVLSEAWDHLRDFPQLRIALKHADGRSGYAESAPFDRIMVTAAASDLEPAWFEQLAKGGLLLVPLIFAPGLAYVAKGTVSAGVFHGQLTRAAYFMPLRAEGEAGAAEEAPLKRLGETRAWPAPWADWFDRKRPRTSWLGFIQALAFYGLLRGLTVHYRTLASGESVYGVQAEDSVCWLGAKNWQVSGESGRELGRSLWRDFLDAGGPRPAEFDLQAVPCPRPCMGMPSDRPGAGMPPNGLRADRPDVYLRQGVRCQQRWELKERSERPVWL